MNSILQLKGRFEQRSNRSRPGSPKLPKGKSVSASHLRELEKQLERILVYWTENKDIRGALVSVHYKHIVAKSNRLKILLSENGKFTDRINSRGPKFVWEPDQKGNEVQKSCFYAFCFLAGN